MEIRRRETVVRRRRASTKTFATRGGEGRTTALEGIDLDHPGRASSCSSSARPGCGKCTLLRLIGDLTAPTAGSVEVNGKPRTQARLDREYGMVFQAPVLFDWRTVEDNVRLPLELIGMDRAPRQRRAPEMLLELVELGDFMRHYPYQLSGGMQQRVAIARALALQPALLLMDEPFGALDEMTRERMNTEVLRIWEQTGTTVVFVTHSIPEAVFLSTRVAVMSARPGRITRLVDVDLPQPRNELTRESRATSSSSPRCARRCAGRGVEGPAHRPSASPPRAASADGVHG